MPFRPIRAAALAAALLLTVVVVASASAAPSPDRVERAVVKKLRHIRSAHGMSGLRPHRALNRVADRHSRRMARRNVLYHGAFQRRVGRLAGGRTGETVAVMPGRRRLARRVVRAWMASPPHRAVLLDPRVRRIGIARRSNRRGWFFTADVATAVRRRH